MVTPMWKANWAVLVALANVLFVQSAAASDAGKQFFFKNVVPRLAENGCQSCHTVGYVRPQVFTYEETLKYLAMGDSPQNSVIIYKLANLRSISPNRPTHPGGQRCTSVDAEPCKTIIQWWKLEFSAK